MDMCVYMYVFACVCGEWLMALTQSLTRSQGDRGISHYGKEDGCEEVDPHPKPPGGHQIEIPVLGVQVQVLSEVLIGRLLFAESSDSGKSEQ